MKLFFHHVGQAGSSEDFKKTVFRDVPISIVEENIPSDEPLRSEILQTLHAKFPSGYFNCWGVPEGAKPIIRNLAEGDCVLLVESARIDGRVPALCYVEAYWQKELRALSYALWGNDKFPYIFFFRTDEITLQWPELLNYLGYMENFDPRGKFYSIADSRLDKFGGAEKFIGILHTKYSITKKAFDIVTVSDLALELNKDEMAAVGDVRSAIEDIKKKSLSPEPRLREGLGRQTREVYSRPRNAAFVIAVRRLYGYRCTFCGASLRSPNGQPEVQSAHIYPKKFDGSDDVRNGICVCRRHHWAFDVGWITIANDYTALVRPQIPSSPEYGFIYELAGKRIQLPPDDSLTPHEIFLREHRILAGFE